MIFFTNCSNQKKETRVEQTKSTSNNPVINDDKPTVKITEYTVPDYSPVLFISIISSKEIYVFTNYKVFLFDGNKFTEIYKVKNQSKIIRHGDCNGKYLILSLFDQTEKELFKPNLVLLKLTRKNTRIITSGEQHLTLPFSNTIADIKFIKKNYLLIIGFIEYCTLTFKNIKGTKENIYVIHHYTLKSKSAPFTISFGSTSTRDINILFTRHSIFYKDINSSSDELLPLIDLKDFNYSFDIDNGINKVSTTDTTFGWFNFGTDNFFFKKEIGQKPMVYPIDTLYDNKNSKLSAKNILRVIPFSENNIWALTKNGEILHQVPSNDGWNKKQWNEISQLKNFQPTDASAIDSNCIYLYGNSFIKVQLLSNSNRNNQVQKKIPPNNYLFYSEYLISIRAAYGVGVADFDNNNKSDLYIVNIYGKNELYLNESSTINFISPNFESAPLRGITGRIVNSINGSIDLSSELGLAIDDFNENGNQDIYITRLAGSNLLFLNNGRGYFKNATNDMNLSSDIGRSECAVAADVNNSGYLDIFTSSFFSSNWLFINNKGDGFIDETKKYKLTSNGSTVCAAFGDINNDGYEDLYIGNWGRENKLYLNNGDGTFKDITSLSGTGCGDLKETNSVMFADFNNDGLLDLFVGNRGTGNKLFLNLGDGKFEDVTKQVGLNDSTFTYGAAFGDFDNDGYLDLFISYLGGFKIYKNMMGENNGKLYFKDVTDSYLGKSEIFNSYNTSVVTADFDKDGDLDIFASQNGGSSILFDNLLHQNFSKNDNYLEVKVEGSQSNRDGVGAKLKLFRNDSLIAYREVFSGYGYASSSSKIQHFGLGDGKGNYKLQVTFPKSGVVKMLSVVPNTFITVKEHEGIVESYFLAKKDLIRYILGKDFIITTIKFILFLVFMILISKIKIFRSALDSANDNKLGKVISFSFPVMFMFIGLYLILEFIFYYSQNFYMSSYYYMSNTRNIFVEDAMPFIISLTFVISYLKLKKDRELKNIGSEELVVNLWTLLRRFEHGEGMLMNINRLSLFIKNIAFDANIGVVPKAEILERVLEIIEEYKRITMPELKKISSLLIQIEENKYLVKNKNASTNSFNLLSSSKIISESSIRLLNTSEELIRAIGNSIKDIDYKIIVKLTEEFENGIKILKNQITELRNEIKNYFVTDILKVFEFVIKKFKPNLKGNISIDYSVNINNPRIFITFSELNEILAIIIKNAIDEVGKNENDYGIIKILINEVGPNVILKIEDNGKGIPENKIELILKEGLSTKLGNHGFGLHYVQSCLEKYDGKITVGQSSLGGASFEILLNKL